MSTPLQIPPFEERKWALDILVKELKTERNPKAIAHIQFLIRYNLGQISTMEQYLKEQAEVEALGW